MSQVVWKYPMTVPETVLDLPEDARVLCVQVQHEVPNLWVLLDPDRPAQRRRFGIAGTGHPIDIAGLPYVGTFQLFDGGFVGHVFELPVRQPVDPEPVASLTPAERRWAERRRD